MHNGFLLEPDHSCSLCPRLSAFRSRARQENPSWYNAPVPAFGTNSASLLIVGLAPGLRGANRTGRPFTGDYAGDLLYATLIRHGFAKGRYLAHPKDGIVLNKTRITNAVRCVPPQNKPTTTEIASCRFFLKQELASLFRLRAILALGRIAHDSILSAFSRPRSQFPFHHGATHHLSPHLTLFDSYHCSRYNVQTKRLTGEMFEDVFLSIHRLLSEETLQK